VQHEVKNPAASCIKSGVLEWRLWRKGMRGGNPRGAHAPLYIDRWDPLVKVGSATCNFAINNSLCIKLRYKFITNLSEHKMAPYNTLYPQAVSTHIIVHVDILMSHFIFYFFILNAFFHKNYLNQL
jgi:hypothetical protein